MEDLYALKIDMSIDGDLFNETRRCMDKCHCQWLTESVNLLSSLAKFEMVQNGGPGKPSVKMDVWPARWGEYFATRRDSGIVVW